MPLYQLKELSPDHREIIRRRAMGQTTEQIAKETGFSKIKIRVTLTCDLGRERLKELMDQRDANAVNISAQLDRIAPKAVGVLDHILDSDAAPHVKVSVAKDVLNRAGYKSFNRGNRTGDEQTRESIRKLVDRAKQLNLTGNREGTHDAA